MYLQTSIRRRVRIRRACLQVILLSLVFSVAPGVAEPDIDITRSESGAADLTWPQAETGMVVQTSRSIEDGEVWEVIPRSPFVQGDDYVLSVTLGPRDMGFYRLVQPGYATAVAGGLAYLQISQTDSGTWGAANGEERRMVHAIIDVLAGFGAQDLAEFEEGVRVIEQFANRNHDDTARRAMVIALGGRDATPDCDVLLDGQNGAVTNMANVDYPGFGWGLGPGLDNDHIDTALAVRALKQAGKPVGLGLGAAQLTLAQGTALHRFILPTGATGFELRIAEQTGALKYTLQPPGGVTQSLTNPASSVPLTVPLDASFPGVWTLTVENLAGVDVSYSLAVGFMVPGGYDAFRAAAAFDYLTRHQNGDGGWGLRPGEPSLLVVTHEVMRSLAACGRDNYGQWLDPGAAWLLTKQNPDGGFSTEPDLSNVYETSLALAGVRMANPTNLLSSAMTWLTDRQLDIGSWDDDPYLTALAIQALSLAPIVSGIPDQTVGIPTPFAPIMLDDFVLDPDHADSLLSWSASGQSALSVSITNRIASVAYPSNTVVAEQITFTATDPDGLTGQATAIFIVQSLPPDYTIAAGGSVNDSFLITSVAAIPASFSEIVSSTEPPGITFALGPLTGSGNQRTQQFTVSVAGGTTPGIYDFTVVIRLMDLTTFPFVEVPNLNGTTQDYRIEVTP